MATKDRTALKDEFKNGNLATGERFADLIDSMKVVQLPVVDPQALGKSLSFIDSISQDADGVITATKKTLDLANAHELNPFKGWYKTGDTLPTDGFDGAYLYFKDTSELTGQTTIYRWNGTAYADTGTVVDTSNVQTFGSGQAVNAVKIKNENGDEVSGNANVLSAEAGAELAAEVAKKAEYQNITGKNLINPSEVQLNKYIQFNGSTGAFNPTAPNNFTGAACSGLIPVEAGETYYLTRGTGVSSTTSAVFVFIKEDGEHITEPLDPATDTPMIATQCDGSKAFKAPSDAKYALICLAFSGWTDTATQIVGFQFEKGSTPTEYEPYQEPKQIIPFEHLPEELSNIPEEISNLQEQIDEIRGGNDKLFVYDSNLDATSYIESPLTTGKSCRNNFIVKRAIEQSGGHSECFNFSSVEIKTNSGTTVIALPDDDICPTNINGYYGANHGEAKFYACTVQNHGKTFADIGSIYSSAGHSYTIVDIRDENTLVIGPTNTQPTQYPNWYFYTPTSGAYTHVSGGTNTASFTVSAATMKQGKPIIKLDETFIYVDGKRVNESGSYKFSDKVVISQNYKIANPASILSILQTNVGTYTDHPIYSELDGVDYMEKLNISYIFTDAFHCFVAQTLTFLQALDFSSFGFIQSAVIRGNNTKMYIPKALPFNSIDFRTNPSYNATTITSTVNLTSEYWENPLLPPDRYIQSSNNCVFSAGYLFDYGVGGNNRKDVINNAFEIPMSSRKAYPRGIDSKIGTTVVGSSYYAVCYRIYQPKEEFDTDGKLLTNVFEYDNKLYIYADFNAAGTYEIAIPGDYIGKIVEVFEKSDNVSFSTQINTITVNVSTANPMYGYLVAQIK